MVLLWNPQPPPFNPQPSTVNVQPSTFNPRRQGVRDPLLLYIVTNCLLKKPSTRLTVKDVALNLQQIPGCPRLAL